MAGTTAIGVGGSASVIVAACASMAAYAYTTRARVQRGRRPQMLELSWVPEQRLYPCATSVQIEGDAGGVHECGERCESDGVHESSGLRENGGRIRMHEPCTRAAGTTAAGSRTAAGVRAAVGARARATAGAIVVASRKLDWEQSGRKGYPAKDLLEDFVGILQLTVHNLKFENMLKQNEERGGAQRLYELRKELRAMLMDVDPNIS
ncbi:hypothetical protein B0H14DRAFT_2655849 [Mycena olivaceomarginata]|nr:hypothetical protein B0H14DRAFT_2655849 [Mycena olivaceomarginata]